MSISKVKSYNHLLSNLKETETTQVLLYSSYKVFKGIMCKLNNVILFFWGGGHMSSLESLDKNYKLRVSKTQKVFISQKLAVYGSVTVVSNLHEYRSLLGHMGVIIFTDEIDSQLQKCLQENKKQFESIFRQYITQEDSSVYLSYILCGGNATYMSWVLKQRIKNGISWYVLQRIMNFAIVYPQLISKLSKGNIIPYDGKHGIVQLTNEIHLLQCTKRVDMVLNKFNTNQKKLLKALPKDKTIISSFSKFDQLSEIKQRNFIRKVSTMEDVNEILNQLSFVVSNHFNWNKKSIIEYLNNVENLNYDIVVDKDDILLLNIKDYETIKRIGKTTNWCISKNKSYWRNYMDHPNRVQYVLIDLTQKEDSEHSIIGFTVETSKGIIAAHSFTNKDILNRRSATYENNNFTSIFNKVTPSNVYSILKKHSIDQSMFLVQKNDDPWEVDFIIDKLDELCGGDFDIVRVINDNAYFIRMHGESWKEILDTNQTLRHTSPRWGDYLIYLDFNLPKSNSSRILYIPIDRNLFLGEEYVTSNVMYDSYGNQTNINFEKFINSNNIDYDIICRLNTLENNLLSICANDDKDGFENFIKEHHDNLPLMIQKIGSSRVINDFINRSINMYYSTDIVEILFKYNLSISDFILDTSYLYDFYSHLVNKILRNLDREWAQKGEVNRYTDVDIENLKKNPMNINVWDEIHRPMKEVGLFNLWVLDKIIACEKPKGLCEAINCISLYDISTGTLSSMLLKEMLKKLGANDIAHHVFENLMNIVVGKISSNNNDYTYLLEELSKFHYWNDTLKKNKAINAYFLEVLQKNKVKV